MSDERSHQSRARSALGLLWRTLVVALGYTVAVMIGGMIAQVLSPPTPSLTAGVDQAQMLLVIFLSGVLFGLTMGPLSERLRVPGAQRAILLFVVLFVLNNLINVTEALFFTTAPPAELLAGSVTSAVGHAGLALLLAALFQPASMKGGLVSALREALAQRRWVSWIWRFALAGVLYVPIYLFFGVIISPIVLPYYQQLDMGLTVPGFDVILLLEIFRGLLAALTLFLLIAALRGSRRSAAFWVVLTLCVLGSWQPMLQAAWWPIPLRVTHGLEITADSIVQGLAITLLLWRPARDT